MFKRFRRLRINSNLRDLVIETSLSIKDFIYPLFIVEWNNIKKEISSMPDVFQMSIDIAIKECEELKTLGLNSILLFWVPNKKDEVWCDAMCNDWIIAKAIKELKNAHPDIFIITDLCFCEYTDHGHCGILDMKNKTVDNDKTLDILAKQALVHARSWVDMIAPSGMMDWTIITLREVLDKSGFENLPIMSYSTKFASAFFGPFREAAQSAPSFWDRKSYQMNPANRLEAIEESLQDEIEWADILMVKPALAYLDIVREIRNNTRLPIAVYNVSWEYSMLKLAWKEWIIDYKKVLLEQMISFKRAWANIIISYHAKEVAKLLK